MKTRTRVNLPSFQAAMLIASAGTLTDPNLEIKIERKPQRLPTIESWMFGRLTQQKGWSSRRRARNASNQYFALALTQQREARERDQHLAVGQPAARK